MPRRHRALGRFAPLTFIVSIAAGVASASAASIGRQIAALYTPYRVQQAAMAPDGRHVAFTVFNGRGIEVQIVDLDEPGPGRRVPLDERANAETSLLVWSAADRLVAASDTPVILAIDAAGGPPQRFTDGNASARGARRGGPDSSGRTARVLGLAPDNPDCVLVEATVAGALPPAENIAGTEAPDLGAGNDVTVEVYQLNLRTGARQRIFERALPAPGGSVLVDRQGAPRLVFMRGTLPQRFDYHPPGMETSGWKDLDRVLNDRKTFAFAVTPENFAGARTLPLGFGTDPNVLYYASNLGRDTFAVYAVDLRSGTRTPGAIEDPAFDLAELDAPWVNSPLIFDRKRRSFAGLRLHRLETATHWIDPEIVAVQTVLAEKFPSRGVQLLDWDDARDRFVVLVASAGDPGRYFVFHRTADRCVEYLRRAPSLDPADANHAEPFAFVTPAGAPLSGSITVPHAPAVAEPPLVIWLRDATVRRVPPDFDRDAQALAAMGFVVAQLNYRGSPGFGLAQREALHRDLDHGPVADVLATIEWLASRQRFDRRRVAVVGEGFGGFLALRALQLQPAAFRCAVAIDAPVDLGDLKKRPFRIAAGLRGITPGGTGSATVSQGGSDGGAGLGGEPLPSINATAPLEAADLAGPSSSDRVDFDAEFLRWFVSGVPRLGDLAVTKHPELLTKPIFLLHHPDNRYAPVASVRSLRDDLVRRKLPPTYLELRSQGASDAADVRGNALRKIGEFLNTNLYDFGVKLGDLTEKE